MFQTDHGTSKEYAINHIEMYFRWNLLNTILRIDKYFNGQFAGTFKSSTIIFIQQISCF